VRVWGGRHDLAPTFKFSSFHGLLRSARRKSEPIFAGPVTSDPAWEGSAGRDEGKIIMTTLHQRLTPSGGLRGTERDGRYCGVGNAHTPAHAPVFLMQRKAVCACGGSCPRCSSQLAPRRSTPVGHRLGHDPIDQALLLQRTIENQATSRRLARLGPSRTAEKVGDDPEQEDPILENMMAQEPLCGASWDFSKIPAFPPERVSRAQTPFPPAAMPVRGAIQANTVVGKIDDPLERDRKSTRLNSSHRL